MSGIGNDEIYKIIEQQFGIHYAKNSVLNDVPH
jgi:hypothetical protein